MPGKSSKPLGLRRCVADVAAKDGDVSRAFAICTKSLQKAGVLKKGTQKLTKKGAGRTAGKYSKESDVKEKDAAYEKLIKGESTTIESFKARLNAVSELVSCNCQQEEAQSEEEAETEEEPEEG